MSDTLPVFLVDDDPQVRKAVSRLLEYSGFEVVAFESPKKFLEDADPDAGACLVLDIAMPELTGLDIQKALATRARDLPVIFLTGNADVPMTVQAMERGAVDSLTKIKELGIDENTIVFYSTDNGAETFTWPDGGTIPFHGEKGTTWEGGFRVPSFIKWPGVIAPGTKLNGIASHEDMIPTLLAAVGEPDIKEKLKKGLKIDGKEYKVHLDGYNLLPWFKGEVENSPRKEIMYFDQVGNLNAIRYNNWKLDFAILEGNIASAQRIQTAWPKIINLRADPFERAWHESELYTRWMAENMWLFVPAQAFARQWLQSFEEFPPRRGTTLGIDSVIRQLANPAPRQ